MDEIIFFCKINANYFLKCQAQQYHITHTGKVM